MPTVVSQDPTKPVPREILADSIIVISRAMRDLTARGRLNRAAIVVLIRDDTKLSKREIVAVMDAIEDLERMYVTPAKPGAKS